MIEFPTTDDPLVRRLLARKRRGLTPTTSAATSSAAWASCFDVRSSEELSSGTRVLYVAEPKA